MMHSECVSRSQLLLQYLLGVDKRNGVLEEEVDFQREEAEFLASARGEIRQEFEIFRGAAEGL
jgi:hypothetical protein